MLSGIKQSKQEDLPFVIPTSARDVVLEPQSPINKKSEAKALTPPVSLKHFFQVQPKPADMFQRVTTVTNKQESTVCVESESLEVKSRTELLGKLIPTQTKLMDSFAVSSPTPTAVKGKPSKMEKGQSLSKRKRKPIAEPDKYTSLAKMFKKESSLPSSMCPVCGARIEDVSNCGINRHIDKCLAKSSSASSINQS
jgi:hypothetical protein